MTGFEWNPDTYLPQMLDEVPGFEELQEAVVAATDGLDVRAVLELGTGTGETALRLLVKHTNASWTGIDASETMLARARERLPQAELHVARLEDPLPSGPFDLVVSVLTVHHLPADGKRDLFRRVAEVADTFVLGDVVVPARAEDAAIYIDWVMDLPSSVPEQLAWLDEVGFVARAEYVRPDLAVFFARRRSR